MTKNKRFKLDFDENVFIDEYEKGELKRSYTIINGKMKEYQLQEIVDLLNKLNNENEELKKENNDLKTSKEYWREKCLSKDSYNKFHHKAPIWFTQELKLTNKEVNKVAEAIEQDLKERRLENE